MKRKERYSDKSQLIEIFEVYNSKSSFALLSKNAISIDLKLNILNQLSAFLYLLSNFLAKRATNLSIASICNPCEEYCENYILNYSDFLKESSKISPLITSMYPTNKLNLEIYLAEKLVLDISSLKSCPSVQKSYLNQIHIEEHMEITKHMIEFSSKALTKRLYKIMMLSKEFSDILIAASNAATILNKIGFSFNRRNMSGIKIPYADLSKGRFIETDFSNSDLRYTDFTNSTTICANFNDSLLPPISEVEKILTGWKDKWKIEKIIFSPCQKYMAISFEKKSAYFQFLKCIKVFWIEAQFEPKVLELESSNINRKASMSFSIDSHSIFIIDASDKLKIWNYHENVKAVINAYPQNRRIEPYLSNQYLIYLLSNKIWIKHLPSLDVIFEVSFEARNIHPVFSKCNNYIAWNTDTQIYIFSLKARFLDKKLITSENIIFLQNNILGLYNRIMRRYEIWDTNKEEMMYKYEVSKRNSNGIELLISGDGKFLVFWVYNKIVFVELRTQLQTMVYFLNQVSIKRIIAKFNMILANWGIYAGINKSAWKLLKHSQTNKKIDLDEISRHLLKSINWSPCGKFIWFLYENGLVKEWSMKMKKWRQSLDFSKTKYKSCALSGNLAGIIDEFCQNIEIWDIYSQSKIKMIYMTHSEDNIEEFSISAATNRAYILGCYSSIYVYDIDIGQIILFRRKIFNCLFSAFFGDYYVYTEMNCVTFLDMKNDIKDPIMFECEEIIKVIPSLSNQWIALFGSSPNILFLLNWNDRSPKSLTCGEKQETACFSPREKYLASSSSSQIILWDIATGCIIAKTSRYFNSPSYIAYSPMGKYIAQSISGDSIMIYNHKKCLKEYKERKSANQTCDLKLEIKLELATIVSE